MGTGAAWADVCLGEGEDAWLSLSDLKDYLYGCSIPTGLSKYFCFDDVDYDFITTLNGPDILDGGGDRTGRWCPALKVLPMGWS